jgi:hypothetical protein
VQEFDLLSQRIHPAASRVEKLAADTPAAFVALDVPAIGGEVLMDAPFAQRRDRLAALDLGPVRLTPVASGRDGAGQWLTGASEGVIAKRADAAYLPGEPRVAHRYALPGFVSAGAHVHLHGRRLRPPTPRSTRAGCAHRRASRGR